MAFEKKLKYPDKSWSDLYDIYKNEGYISNKVTNTNKITLNKN